MKRFTTTLTTIGISLSLFGQIEVQFLGLDNSALTCLDINFNTIAVGTDRKGVFWRQPGFASDTGWTRIPMDSTVRAVYPHKSGPIGWAIGAGIQPADGNAPFVFCSYQGEEFFPNSDGIEAGLTTQVSDLDGYPDLTVCGETFAVSDRILYRQDFADTVWNPVFTATVEGALSVVKVHEHIPGVVLLGGADGFAGHLMMKSLDFGENWEDISPGSAVSGIDFTGTEADTIFAATGARIYRSTTGGASWDPVYDDHGSVISEILYIPETGTVYAAGGIFPGQTALLLASHDAGISWDEIPLDHTGIILGLEDGRDGWIYFITKDEGAFRFRETTSGTENGNSTATSIRSYPNPAHGTSRIEYVVARSSDVSLQIVDAAGNLLSTLVDEHQTVGQYHVDWNTEGLAPGVYFAVITTAQNRMTGRIVVLR